MLVKKFIVAAVLALVGSSAFAQDGSKTWEGTWVNKKYNSSGTMKCVAKEGKDGEWSATFTGVFMGEAFKHEVKFQATPGKNQMDLAGKAKVKNADYEWTGVMKGDKLTGKYTATNGYNGTFELKETKKK